MLSLACTASTLCMWFLHSIILRFLGSIDILMNSVPGSTYLLQFFFSNVQGVIHSSEVLWQCAKLKISAVVLLKNCKASSFLLRLYWTMCHAHHYCCSFIDSVQIFNFLLRFYWTMGKNVTISVAVFIDSAQGFKPYAVVLLTVRKASSFLLSFCWHRSGPTWRSSKTSST